MFRHTRPCAPCVALAIGVASLWPLWPERARAQLVEEDDSEVMVLGEGQEFDAEIPNLTETARIMVKRTNKFRANQGLASVARNKSLDEAARYFAQFMARTGELGHTVDGQRPTERARDHGYEPCIVGENIGWEFRTSPAFTVRELASEFMHGWKESKDHRETMVDPDVTEIGLAVAYSEENGHFYAVQLFGRPKSQSIELRVANRTATEIQYDLNDKPFWLPAGLVRMHEQCRPTDVVFHFPNDDPEARRQGFYVPRETSLVIVRDAFGNVTVQRERATRSDSKSEPAQETRGDRGVQEPASRG